METIPFSKGQNVPRFWFLKVENTALEGEKRERKAKPGKKS